MENYTTIKTISRENNKHVTSTGNATVDLRLIIILGISAVIIITAVCLILLTATVLILCQNNFKRRTRLSVPEATNLHPLSLNNKDNTSNNTWFDDEKRLSPIIMHNDAYEIHHTDNVKNIYETIQ